MDDCLGSGQQITTFWREQKLAKKVDGKLVLDSGPLLRSWCKANSIDTYYLTLVGYAPNIEEYQHLFGDLKICGMELLDNTHRVFDGLLTYWTDVQERAIAHNFFNNVCLQNSICMYGYNDLDFAVIMHKTIPDWSLPLFWRANPDQSWSILLQRKNSYD